MDLLKDLLKGCFAIKEALRGSSPSTLLIPGLHYSLCNGNICPVYVRPLTQVAETTDSYIQ